MLTQSLLQDYDSPRRSRQQSLLRASTINFRDYRASGIEFERFTVKKSLRVGPVTRNVLAASSIVQEPRLVTRNDSANTQNIIEQFRRKDMEASDVSLHSVASHISQISSTFYEGDVFYNAQESSIVMRKESLITNEKCQLDKVLYAQTSLLKSIAQQASFSQKTSNKVRKPTEKNTAFEKQKMRKKLSKQFTNKKKLTLKVPLSERISQFFGEGINSLILTLGDKAISVLIINLFFDILFRIAVLLYCVKCYLQDTNSKTNSSSTYIFLFPIGSMVFCRLVFFVTIIAMSFDEKHSVSNSFQQWTGGRTRAEMQEDRLFMRQLKKGRIAKTICRSMIPPELWFWEVENPSYRSKIYFLINMVFKGIEIVFLLGTMLVVLLLAKGMERDLRITGFGIMLEEVIRYVVNYLIINTLSR